MNSVDHDWGNRAEQLIRSHGVAHAFTALQDAADAGNSSAYATIANWRMAGHYVRRDLGLAQEAYGKAAALGDSTSRRAYIALLANGASGERNWHDALMLLKNDADGRAELALIDRMALDTHGDPIGIDLPEPLDRAGRVQCIRELLSRDECRYLISLADPSLQPSMVVHPQTGQLVRNPIRTSLAASFPFTAEPPALHAINRRIASATSTGAAQAEPTQILRYSEQQEYRLHIDALPASEPNQRETTFLIYLNDEYSGGETRFPKLNLAFRGNIGDAIMFRNIDTNGKPDDMMSHAGAPVTNGQKYLLSKWIRKNPLDLSGPPGRPF